MQYSYYKIWIAILFVLVSVDATVVVYTPLYSFKSVISAVVATFSNRDATRMGFYPIEGELEYATPSDACSPIVHPFFVPTSPWKNMVLINGTDKCDFMTKVKNAQAAGFEAAILFDPSPEPFNYSDITFPIERSEINITIALVSCKDGIKLQNYLFPDALKKNIVVKIQPSDSSYLFISYLLVFIWVGIPVGLCVLFLVSTFVKKLKKYGNPVQGKVNVFDGMVQRLVSGESEFTPLLAADSSTPNNCPRSTEELKNKLVESLGSVNNVQGSEPKRGSTQVMIV